MSSKFKIAIVITLLVLSACTRAKSKLTKEDSNSASKERNQMSNSRESKPFTEWNGTMNIEFHPIGVVRSLFTEQKSTPIQPIYAQGARGTVVVYEPYRGALKDLNGFSRIWLIYYFDRAENWKPTVLPYRDTQERSLFATRAPSRPNAIGISAVKLISIKEGEIEVDELDVLDGTPVLDIKPYVPMFDSYPNEKTGWLEKGVIDQKSADDRFEKKKK